MDLHVLMTGILIFLARICDVSIGTFRTIVTIQGRSMLSFFLAIAELLIWITVVSAVIHKINDSPVLALFYALGFATGNVVGIALERKIALGMTILKVITRSAGHTIAHRLRAMGQPVTIFNGEGMHGPVQELYIACRRRDVNKNLKIVMEEDATAFYLTEMARDVRKSIRSGSIRFTGWRTIGKRK